MTSIKITEIVNRALNGEVVRKLQLDDASRYASNSRGPLSINTTIFFSGRVHAYHAEDRVITIGRKNYNIDELRRCLEKISNKGSVTIFMGNEMLRGELVE